MVFAGTEGAYVRTYSSNKSGSFEAQELVNPQELQERYQAILEFVTGNKTKPLSDAEGYSQSELLDAVKLYQGGSGPLTRAMINNDPSFVDRDEQYDTKDVANRLKAASQYSLPKRLYSGLGPGQIGRAHV